MINIKKISLKFILPVVFFAIFFLLMGGRYFIDYKHNESIIAQTIKNEITTVVSNLRVSISNALMKSDLAQAEHILSIKVLNTRLDKIAIILPNQHLLLSSDYKNKSKLAEQSLPFYSPEMLKETIKNNEMIVKSFNDNKDIVIFAPINSFNHQNKLDRDYNTIIYAHYSLHTTVARLKHQLLISFLKIIALLAFTLFLFMYIVNYLVIRPINRLSHLIKVSDLNHHIEVEQNGFGEISVLQCAFAQVTGDVKENFINLTKNEKRFAFVLQSVNDGIWDWDVESDKVFYSINWANMLGLEQNKIGTDLDVWESRIHPDDLIKVAQDINFHFEDRTEQIRITHRIMSNNGKYIWILCRAKIVSWDEKGYPMRMVGINTDISKEIEAQKHLNNQIQIDDVTELPNRTHLLSKLSHELIIAKEYKQHGAIIIIGCNQYETLINIKGDNVGNRLLWIIARRLEEFNMDHKFVAYLQGGEFVIIVLDLDAERATAIEKIKKLVEKVDNKLKEFIKVQDQEMILAFTFGVEFFPCEQLSSVDVLRQSSMAMQSAKVISNSNVAFFDKNIENQLVETHNLEIGMQSALEKNEFSLFFQARINTKGDIVGAEALSRWIHSEQGWVHPSEFIKVAEGSKLIIKLGHWVIRSAFEQLAYWEKKGLPKHFTTLSINISPTQFAQEDFVSTIKEALTQTNVSANLIEIEITEAIFLHTTELIIEKMHMLRDLGIQFAIDDFGIGYSSFSYLNMLPVTTIKIDRSFLKNVLESKKQQIIVSAIISMSKKLKLNTVAEGVEKKEQLEMLCRFGCSQFQGFYIYKPLAKNDFQSLLFKKR